MKRLALSIVLAFFTIISVNAQITIGKASEDKQEFKRITPSYDSLWNISRANFMYLKGQTLFVYGTASQKNRGFEKVFFTKKYFESEKTAVPLYMEVTKYGLTYTPFEAVAGKYYLIKDVFEEYNEQYSFLGFNLLLEDIETKENFYMYCKRNEYGTIDNEGYLILGYYEKLKERYIGETFKKLEGNVFIEYTCTDITVKIGDSIYAVLTDNSRTTRTPISGYGVVSGFLNTDEYNSFIKKIAASRKLAKPIKEKRKILKLRGMNTDAAAEQAVLDFIRKYGEFAEPIIEGKVRKGMTREMVIESWGKPDHINTTSGSFGVHEQWVYKGHPSDKYLYFEDGILTTIQN